MAADIVDLDQVWKEMGYSTKQKAVQYLIQHYILNVHYFKRNARRKAGKGSTRIVKYSLRTSCYTDWLRRRNEKLSSRNPVA